MTDLKRKLEELLIERLKFEDMSPEDIPDDEPLFAGGLGLDSIEAMAQLAGGLVFREAHGLLTGIEHCQIDRPIEPGDIIALTVTLEAEFGGTYRFSGTGSIGGLQCVRGRFYLAQA